MADVKITGLTATTTPLSTDLAELAVDPGGTPASRKVTLANLITKAHGLSDGLVKVASGVMSNATAGSDYAVGSTGLAGGQTIAGGTLTTQNLTLRANAADTTTGTVAITTSTASTSSSTGALTVAGGVGIGGAAYFGTYANLNIAASAPSYAEGNMYWDSNDHTLAIQQGVDDVVLQVGQEMYVRVRNSTGATIPNGSVVYISGATGNRPNITLAQANSAVTSEVIGVATHNIENNTDGLVTISGIVRDIDTSAFAAGDKIYISAATPGAFTNVAPAAPNFVVLVGEVVQSNPANGAILVTPQPFVAGVASIDSLRLHSGFLPAANDGFALGSATLSFSDLFLASGGVLNWNNGDITLTHSADTLTLGGGNLALGANSITSGTWSGTEIGVTKGGTGLTAVADASVLVTNAANTFTVLTAGASQSIRRNAGNTAWEAYTPSGIAWNDSITGTSGTGLALTVGNSASASTIGQSITIGDTQSSLATCLSLNLGAASTSNRGIDIVDTTATAGHQAIRIDTFRGLYGLNVSFGGTLNDTTNRAGINIATQNNAGAGYTSAVFVDNASTKLNTTAGASFGQGAAFRSRQTGAAGTSIAIFGDDNVNSSTNGLVNYTLSNTQSGATVMCKADSGTSAQGHTLYRGEFVNASISARGVDLNLGTTGTGRAFNITTSGAITGTQNASYSFFSDKSYSSSSAGVAFNTPVFSSRYDVTSTATTGTSTIGNTTTNGDFVIRRSYTPSAGGGLIKNQGDILYIVTRNEAGATTGVAQHTHNMIRLDNANGPGDWNGAYLIATTTSTASNMSARTASVLDIKMTRQNTATTGTLADSYDFAILQRTSVQNGAGGTLTAAGSVLKLENVATQTAGVLTDTVTPLLVVQDADSTGVPVAITQNAVVTTNFRKIISETVTGCTIWVSNGTNPNASLSGQAGDICLNGDLGNIYRCTGTTNWTAM